jgi:hypothetical protein
MRTPPLAVAAKKVSFTFSVVYFAPRSFAQKMARWMT